MGYQLALMMFLVAVGISSVSMSAYVLLHYVKNDAWIYGEDLAEYADERGIIDWERLCLKFPKFNAVRNFITRCRRTTTGEKKMKTDRAAEARTRAKARA